MFCQSCNATIPAEDVNIQAMVAKCRQCDTVFSFREDYKPQSAAKLFPRPAKITVSDSDPIRILTYRWYHPIYLFLLLFSSVWILFLVFWYSIVLGKMNQGGPMAMVFLFVPTIHIVVGIVLTYVALAGLLNRTTISVDESDLTISHGPIYGGRRKCIAINEIHSLFSDCRSHYSKAGRPLEWFFVSAVLADNTEKKLLQSLDKSSALFIVQSLNTWLELKPSPLNRTD